MNITTTLKLTFASSLLLTCVACGGGGGGGGGTVSAAQVANATSSICNNVRGLTAIWWDVSNGIPRGDLPGFPPVIKNIGGTYGHGGFPLLGFNYPAGWTPMTTTDPGSVGVNLLRNDGQALYRNFQITVAGQINARQVRDIELNQIISHLQFNGQPTFICTQEGQAPIAGGTLFGQASNALVQVGNHTALITANVTFVQGLATSNVSVQVHMAPTAQFEQEILDTFMPIWHQMLLRPPGTRDSDGDGIFDVNDAHPNDPTRWLP